MLLSSNRFFGAPGCAPTFPTVVTTTVRRARRTPCSRASVRARPAANTAALLATVASRRARGPAASRTHPGRGPRGVPRSRGAIGLLHLHCAHRGTSLEFGIPRSAAALLLPRLAVRRRRALPRDARRARGQSPCERVGRAPIPSLEYGGLSSRIMGPPDQPPLSRSTTASSGRRTTGSPPSTCTCRAIGCRSSRTAPTRSTTRFCTPS